jgi:threonine/homoserine/homoserine lactone efflux protein
MQGKKYVGIFFAFVTGIGVSFLGAAPLGTLNIAALQVTLARGTTAGMLYSAGAISVEMIFILFSLLGVEWIQKQEKLFRTIEWITVIIVLGLAAGSMMAALHPKTNSMGNMLFDPAVPSYLIGVSFRLFLPTMVPFWLGWNTLLFSKNILRPNYAYYLAYIPGAGLGTFLAHLIYIQGGSMATEAYQLHQVAINWGIGALFMAIALFQIARLTLARPKIAAD